MELPTGDVPESYKIYVDQFEDDPQGTLHKLKAHVKRRNSGAVGYYLLALLSQKAGQNERAVEFAVTAKLLAPGSRFFSRLPYYMEHPDQFNAWLPESYTAAEPPKSSRKTNSNHPIEDLDMLISRLSGAETKRIRISENTPNDEDLSKKSEDVNDIVTETLAIIHEKQGNYDAAKNVYKQLRLANKSKRRYYERQILRLEQLQKNRSEE
ncbi:MAG: hypothetical protein GVY08_15670 [Bacteroidetes bacterium]|jgi:hypothetical protein|nr:hypothetical protein [Bacteroidota bacterium]